MLAAAPDYIAELALIEMSRLQREALTMTGKTKFSEGDRVKLWNAKDAGTVDESWFEDKNEFVAVVWDKTGCVGTVRAYQLQFA